MSDYLYMIAGVNVYSTMVKLLINSKPGANIDCNLVTCIEDDCERLVNLPAAFFNSVMKVV